MKQGIKGGYILVSLGLIELSTEYQASIDYERISRTKKHIVLTGIKVGGKVMPDVCVKPKYGVGTVFFEDVYGFDIGVHTDNTVDVDVHEEVPNVEKAPIGTVAKMLGLDEDGEVVKGDLPSSGTKLYRHSIYFQMLSNTYTISIITTSNKQFEFIDSAGTNGLKITGEYISDTSSYENSLIKVQYARAGVTNVILKSDNTVLDLTGIVINDTVTEL